MPDADRSASSERGRRRVLVLWYSQTGQLRRVADSVAAPLVEAGYDVSFERLTPASGDYPFPWRLRSFLSVFPDTVAGAPCELAPATLRADDRFDLIVFAYTVWYLSPSLPAQAFFASPVRALMRDTPVITVIACRNMWFNAETRMRKLIDAAGGRHVATIAAIDDGPTWSTFITTPRWLLTGRNDRLWGVLPPAGVSAEKIGSLRRFGEAIVGRFDSIDESRSPFAGLEPVAIDRRMVAAEIVFAPLFGAWARLLRRLGGADRLAGRVGLVAFGAWLIVSVPVIVPLLTLAQLVARGWARRTTNRYLGDLVPDAVS